MSSLKDLLNILSKKDPVKMFQKSRSRALREINENRMNQLKEDYGIIDRYEKKNDWDSWRLGKYKSLYEYHRGEYLRHGGRRNKYPESINDKSK